MGHRFWVPLQDSITLNEVSFGPEEELFIDAKGVSMPSPRQPQAK